MRLPPNGTTGAQLYKMLSERFRWFVDIPPPEDGDDADDADGAAAAAPPGAGEAGADASAPRRAAGAALTVY